MSPLKKISTPNYKDKCNHPEHNPPSHYVYEDGTYEYTCPACGNKQTFTVTNPTL